jgi:hypothetical protein
MVEYTQKLGMKKGISDGSVLANQAESEKERFKREYESFD